MNNKYEETIQSFFLLIPFWLFWRAYWIKTQLEHNNCSIPERHGTSFTPGASNERQIWTVLQDLLGTNLAVHNSGASFIPFGYSTSPVRLLLAKYQVTTLTTTQRTENHSLNRSQPSVNQAPNEWDHGLAKTRLKSAAHHHMQSVQSATNLATLKVSNHCTGGVNKTYITLSYIMNNDNMTNSNRPDSNLIASHTTHIKSCDVYQPSTPISVISIRLYTILSIITPIKSVGTTLLASSPHFICVQSDTKLRRNRICTGYTTGLTQFDETYPPTRAQAMNSRNEAIYICTFLLLFIIFLLVNQIHTVNIQRELFCPSADRTRLKIQPLTSRSHIQINTTLFRLEMNLNTNGCRVTNQVIDIKLGYNNKINTVKSVAKVISYLSQYNSDAQQLWNGSINSCCCTLLQLSSDKKCALNIVFRSLLLNKTLKLLSSIRVVEIIKEIFESYKQNG